jgi:hypothetical protein
VAANAPRSVAPREVLTRPAAAMSAGAADLTVKSGSTLGLAYSLGGATVTLTAAGTITQTAGALSGTTLAVTTLNDSGAAITLGQATNAFTNISLRALNAAGATTEPGAITYVDADGFAVAGNGIRTTDTATLTATASGAVTESTGVTIQAGKLALLGAGPFTLTEANLVSYLGATVSGALSFTNNGAFAVDAVGSTSGIALSTSGSTLTLNGGSNTITLNKGLSTNAGAITVQSPVALGATVTVTNGGTTASGADISFSSTISGADELTLTAGGSGISVTGAIGATALTSLTTTSTGQTSFGASVTTTGAQSITSATILTNGTHTTTASSITFAGALTLSGDTTVSTGTGTVSFGGTVDSAASSHHNLTVSSASTLTWGGAIGSTTTPGILTVPVSSSIPSLALNGDLVLNGGTTTLGNNAHTIGGSVSGSGTLASPTSAGSIAVGGSWSVAGYTNNGATITFNGATTPATLQSNSQILGPIVVSKTNAAATVTLSGSLASAGLITLTNGVLAAGTAAISAAGFVDAGANGFTYTSPETVTLTGGNLGGTRFDNLLIFGTVAMTGTVTAAGSFTVSGTGSLSASSATTATAGSVTLSGSGVFNGSNISFTVNGTGGWTDTGFSGSWTAPAGLAITGTSTLASSHAQGNLTIGDGSTATSVTLGNTLTVGGLLSILGSATLSTGSDPFAISTVSWSNAGTFTANAGTVTFTGTGTMAGTMTGTSAFYDLAFNGSTTANAAFTTTRDLSVGSSGTLAVSGTNLITVGRNWTNGNASAPTGFSAGTSTVVFGSGTHAIAGATNFANLSDTATGSTLTFTAGQTFGVSGLLTLTGAKGSLITVQSSSSGSTWSLNNTGTNSVSFVSISDSPATTASISAANSVCKTSNNTNWIFGAISWEGTTSTDTNDATNWSTGVVPGAYDSVSVPSTAPHQPVQTATLPLKALTLSNTASSWNTEGYALSITDALSNTGTFTYTYGGTGGTGVLSFGSATMNAGSTFVYAGTSTLSLLSGITTYVNLTVSNSAGVTAINGVAVSGTTTIDSGGLLTIPSGFTLAAGTFSNSGTLALSAGTLGCGSFTSTGSVTNAATGAAINASGAVSITGTTFSNPTYNTLTMTGSGVSLACTSAIGTLVVNSSGTITNTAALTLDGALTLKNGILALVSTSLNVAGSITRDTAGSITSSSTTGTITLDGGVAQTADFTGSTIPNLTVNNTNGVTLNNSAAFPWNGDCTLTAGTLAMVALDQTIGGSVTGVGTLSAPSGKTLSVGGSSWSVSGFTANSGTVDFTAANTISASSGFYNLTKSGTGTTTTYSAAHLSVANDLIISAGTLALADYTGTQTVGGSVSGAGTLNAAAISGSGHILAVTGNLGTTGTAFTTLTAPAGTLTVGGNWNVTNLTSSGGTVEFDGSSTQTVTPNGRTFGAVAMTGTGGVALTGIAIFGSLSVSLGETFTVGGGATTSLTVNGAFTNSGTTDLSSTVSTAPCTLTMASGTTITNSGTLAVTSSTGTVTLAGASATATTTTFTLGGANELSIASGCGLTLSGMTTGILHTIGANETLTLGDAATFSGGLTVSGSSAVVAVGANTLTVNPLTITTGTVSVGTGSIAAGTSALTIGSSGILDSIGASHLTAGSLSNSGTLTIETTTPASWAISGDFASTGTITNSVASTVSVGGNLAVSGTFSTPASSSITMSGGSATVNTATKIGNLATTGSAALTALTSQLQLAGNLILATSTSLKLAALGANIEGSASGSGTASLNGGSVDVTIAGNFTVPVYTATSATTYIGGTTVTFSTLTATSGMISLDGTTTPVALTTGGQTFNKLSISSTGTKIVNVTGDLTTASSTGTLTVGSNCTLAVGNNTLSVGSTTSNSGTITLGTSSATFTGLVTSGGTLTGSSGTINLNGGLDASGGSFTASSGTTNVGANLTFTVGTTFTTNSGLLDFNGSGSPVLFTTAGKALYDLTLSGSAKTVEAHGDVVIGRNLELDSGQTLDLASLKPREPQLWRQRAVRDRDHQRDRRKQRHDHRRFENPFLRGRLRGREHHRLFLDHELLGQCDPSYLRGELGNGGSGGDRDLADLYPERGELQYDLGHENCRNAHDARKRGRELFCGDLQPEWYGWSVHGCIGRHDDGNYFNLGECRYSHPYRCLCRKRGKLHRFGRNGQCRLGRLRHG